MDKIFFESVELERSNPFKKFADPIAMENLVDCIGHDGQLPTKCWYKPPYLENPESADLKSSRDICSPRPFQHSNDPDDFKCERGISH